MERSERDPQFRMTIPLEEPLEREIVTELAIGRCTPEYLATQCDADSDTVREILQRLQSQGLVDEPADDLFRWVQTEPQANLIDFAGTWHSFVRVNDDHRKDPLEDRAFWEEHAPTYDDEIGPDPASRAALIGRLQATDSVLEVGCGTGRFTLPMAQTVESITALDHAPAMLEQLRERLNQDDIHNVEILQEEWETATVPKHDVVVAAWCLYRQPNLLSALEKLIQATNRQLLILDSAAGDPPHQNDLSEIFDVDDSKSVPRALYYAGALWQLGYYPDLQVLWEPTQHEAESLFELASELAPDNAASEDIETFAERLQDRCVETNTGWRYSYQMPVGLIDLQRGNTSEQ